MIVIGYTGPPKPDKFRMYHNLAAAPAFLILAQPFFYEQYLSYNGLLLAQCQFELWLPAWTPAWTLVASLDVSLDYCCIYIVKVFPFSLNFGGVAPPDCLYMRRDCSQQAGSEERERWASQLSRTPSKAGARDSEQHSSPSGSSLVTLPKLEIPQYSANRTRG
jgi:hypothetical protein